MQLAKVFHLFKNRISKFSIKDSGNAVLQPFSMLKLTINGTIYSGCCISCISHNGSTLSIGSYDMPVEPYYVC